jgi:integrase
MRVGEITGLRWQLVSFGDVENNYGGAMLKINAQLQRISKQTYEGLPRKQDQIKQVFPSRRKNFKTILVLKTPKTKSSERVVWIPPTTVTILMELKKQQDEWKITQGDEYQDYDLVISQNNGRPVEGGNVSEMFATLIQENALPVVEFHSLRHLSTTVKLLISNGDVKSVQGETGHSQAKMVTDTYAHILDGNRRIMAQKFEKSFYSDNDDDEPTANNSLERLITQCLEDPKALAMLKNLLAVPQD